MSTEPTYSPRWAMQITPTASGEMNMSVQAFADGVSFFELAVGLLKGVNELLHNPGNIVLTVDQMQERQRLLDLAQNCPAIRILSRNAEQLWIGDQDVIQQLQAAGWIDAGPVPEGVKRVCDYALNPEKVTTLLTPAAPEA